jgi:uncharacterized protein YecE (DUF72 family)
MNLLVGTSGYSYKEWKGSFYPEDLPAKDMLRDYATRLPAVEINNTFYRLPTAKVLEGWRDQVTESFQFAIKASRRITHFKRLKDADDETGYLLRTVGSLGDHLGVILYQLPPHAKKDLDRLETFLALLADGPRATFEFRHASWHDDEVHACLRRHGCALCISDTDDKPASEIVSTADWGYLRLRRADYDDEAMRQWLQRMTDAGWQDAFVFFKHEEGASGPAMAGRMLELARE